MGIEQSRQIGMGKSRMEKRKKTRQKVEYFLQFFASIFSQMFRWSSAGTRGKTSWNLRETPSIILLLSLDIDIATHYNNRVQLSQFRGTEKQIPACGWPDASHCGRCAFWYIEIVEWFIDIVLLIYLSFFPSLINNRRHHGLFLQSVCVEQNNWNSYR